MKKETKAVRGMLMAGAVAVTALALSGCATVKGAGRDITSVGQAGSDAINGR